jgi:peptidoglycan/LPS O-acetylase OafA/YrhL
MNPRPAPKTASIQVVDLARTLAILPVLALHLKPSLPLPSSDFRWAWDHFQRNGGYGVAMFFVISGFLITRSLDQGPGGAFKAKWKDFYSRRAGRILPLLWLDLFLGLVFCVWLNDGSKKFAYCFKLPDHPGELTFWLSLLFFLFNWARCFWAGAWGTLGGHWGVLWSLAVEEQFYLFYPPLLRGLKNSRNLLWFLGFVILLGFVWRWFFEGTSRGPGPEWKWGSFGSFDGIAVGVGLYFCQEKFKKILARKPRLSLLLCLSGLGLLGLTYLTVWGAEGRGDFYGRPLMEAGVALFLLGGLNLPAFESEKLWLLALPGKYSYGMYLFHIAVLYFLNPPLWNLNIALAYFIFVGVTTVVAALSYHFFETPVNLWVRRKLGAAKRA